MYTLPQDAEHFRRKEGSCRFLFYLWHFFPVPKSSSKTFSVSHFIHQSTSADTRKHEHKKMPVSRATPVQRGCFTDTYEVRQKLGKEAQVRATSLALFFSSFDDSCLNISKKLSRHIRAGNETDDTTRLSVSNPFLNTHFSQGDVYLCADKATQREWVVKVRPAPRRLSPQHFPKKNLSCPCLSCLSCRAPFFSQSSRVRRGHS
jgi:hypothetical protein